MNRRRASLKTRAIHPWLLSQGGLSRGQRARRLAEIGTFVLALAFAAVCAGLMLSGCGVEETEPMQIRTDELVAVNITSGATTPQRFSTFNFTTHPKLAYAVMPYFAPSPGTSGSLSIPWADNPAVSDIVWSLSAQDPTGQQDLVNFRGPRQSLPDGWEDTGTFAPRIHVTIFFDAGAKFAYVSGVSPNVRPVGRIMLRVQWGPQPGACYAPGEYEAIVRAQSLAPEQAAVLSRDNGGP